MTKARPVSRLLRSLVRAGKAQQRLATKLVAVAMPKTVKGSPAATKKRTARAKTSLTMRQHSRPNAIPAPGKWSVGKFPESSVHAASHAPQMSYWLYLPDHSPATVVRRGSPLIVMLHGCHQSATQFAKGTRMNHLVETKGWAVLYPQQPLTAQAHRCWRWYRPDVQDGGGETAVLAALVELVCVQHHIDRQRIYACGISAGAGMAAILALNHPAMFAAVGLHSGPVFGAGRNAMDGLRVMRQGSTTDPHTAVDHMLSRHALQSKNAAGDSFPPMPAILIQGDDDQAVHPVNQHQLTDQWLRINGMRSDRTCERVTQSQAVRGGKRNAYETHEYLVDGKPILRVVRIRGLGHAWSGGDPSERFNAEAGPDASKMILSFFAKYRR